MSVLNAITVTFAAASQRRRSLRAVRPRLAWFEVVLFATVLRLSATASVDARGHSRQEALQPLQRLQNHARFLASGDADADAHLPEPHGKAQAAGASASSAEVLAQAEAEAYQEVVLANLQEERVPSSLLDVPGPPPPSAWEAPTAPFPLQRETAEPPHMAVGEGALVPLDGTSVSLEGALGMAEMTALGGAVLVDRAKIVGRAVTDVVTGSAMEISKGDISGAWKEAAMALYRADREIAAVDEATSAAASASFGILLTFVIVALCWCAEFAFQATKRPGLDDVGVDGRASATALTKQRRSEESRHILHAIDFARYLMAWHVVMDNFYQRGAPWVVFARWGCTAGPWFFMVSGFSHSFSKLSGRAANTEEDFLHGMIKRVAAWYPLFALSLTFLAVKQWSVYAEDWSHYLSDLLMIHGLVWNHEAFPFMLGSWWFSYLMVYLLAFSSMHHIINNSQNTVIWTLFTIAFLVVIPSSIFEWFTPSELPFLACLQLWPAFLVGQALATWFVRNCMQEKAVAPLQDAPATTLVYVMRPAHDIPGPVRFGVTISFLVMGILSFSFSPYDLVPLIKKPVTPLLMKGGLIPVQGLMIVGLAGELDPMAKLFSRKPFRWAGKLALSMFVFQTPVYNAVSSATGRAGLTWTFTFSLFLASVLGYLLLEKPWRKTLGLRPK